MTEPKFFNDVFSPKSYQLSVDLTRVDLAAHQNDFSSRVSIFGTLQSGDQIFLHAKDLQIASVSIAELGANDEVARQLENVEFSLDDAGTLAIRSENLCPGNYRVQVECNGKITDSMHGLYPCYYDYNDERKYLLATQFESHHAREVFACVDEPSAKATFELTLATKPGLTILGNMPIKSAEVDGDGNLRSTFEKTPRMSTYLLAFVTGDLQRATTQTKSGVEVNVYATPAQPAESLSWALEHAAKTIDFFDDYFGVPYPLPKSDHVALPDFSSGAMENWGLVTYRETALLADPANSSVSSKQYIAEVVAHELSHQWFGNLVTMKWWNNLWLNESFANMMEYLATNALHPEWRQWEKFASNEGSLAMRRDAIDGVQSVQTEVSSPAEISALFDGAIVYAKGGRLLRMMLAWIGEDAFRAGLKNYFTKFAYANTSGDDLWRCLSEASGKNVGELMNSWILQPGFPVVRAELTNGELKLAQEQFFIGPHQNSERLWPIPLGANASELPEILKTRQISLPFDSPDFLLLNSENSAHFITLYDENLRERIVAAIKAGKLTPSQRTQYLNEQILLTRGGLLPSSALIETLRAYAGETDHYVWNSIAAAIGELKKFANYDEKVEKNLRAFVGDLARPQFEKLGWQKQNGEPDEITDLRETVVGCMLYSENPEIVAKAQELFAQTSLENLDADLRPLIIGAAVRHAQNPEEIVTGLLKSYQETPSAELRNDITAGITATRDTTQISRLIHLLTNTKIIRSQDTVFWFVDLLRNRHAREETWRWLRENWDWIEQTFGGDKSHDYFPRYAASLLATRQQLAEYREFFTPKRSDQALTRAIDMGLLDLEAKLTLIEKDAPKVALALEKA